MSDRWSFYLAIEGFNAACEPEAEVLASVEQLMQAIFRMGRYGCPGHPNQLFVLQCGDGFLVTSELHEESLERCACIAVAIMQHLAAEGYLARGAISEGELVDLQDEQPPELRASLVEDHTYSLHMGLMNTSPVIGTALIRPLAIDRIAPRGPLLYIRRSRVDRLGAGVPTVPIDGDANLASIDWVHMRSPLLDRLRKAATLSGGTGAELERLLDAICRSRPVPEDWASNVRQLLRIPESESRSSNSET